jgi:hypothetical protein
VAAVVLAAALVQDQVALVVQVLLLFVTQIHMMQQQLQQVRLML